jgi:putative ATPase
LGYGKGYKYPHDYPEHFVEEEYLPENLRGRIYYRPSDKGLKERLRKGWNIGKGNRRRLRLANLS